MRAAADDGITPFMAACGSGGSIEIARELKDAGVDLSATNNDGYNAAHWAAQYGHFDMLRTLRDWSVDLSATTNDGWTTAHFAALNGHLDILRALQQGGTRGVFGTHINMRVPKYKCRFQTAYPKALTTLKWESKSGFEAYSSRRFF